MLLSAGQLLGVLIVLTVILIALYLWMRDVPTFIGTTDLTGKTCIVTGANAGTVHIFLLTLSLPKSLYRW